MHPSLNEVKWTNLNDTPKLFDDARINAGFWGRGIDENAVSKFVHPKQIHSARIIPASEVNGQKSSSFTSGSATCEADGIYSTKTGEVIAVQTADCLPVLLAAPEDGVVMAVHCGWRGLASGIVVSALQALYSQGVKPTQLQIAMGPCISSAAFEVGPDVIEAFDESAHRPKQSMFNLCVNKGKGDRWHFDLSMYAVQQLMMRDVIPENIRVFQHCTYTETDLWYSYRRQKQAGRNWSWISLKA